MGPCGSGELTSARAFGVADQQHLSAIVLALLALLAVSFGRQRHDMAVALASQQGRRSEILLTDFPGEATSKRLDLASDYLYAGWTMNRTLSTSRPGMEALLRRGGSVRVSLQNPENRALMELLARTGRYGDSADAIAGQISNNLRILEVMQDNTGGDLEIRLADFPVFSGFNLMDVGRDDGLVMVQHHQFKPDSEPGPILALRPGIDEPWYSNFVLEGERIWAESTEAPRLGRTADAGQG